MNASELNNMLVSSVDSVAPYLLPNGRRHGERWVVGSVGGEKGESLKIELSGSKRGVWSDFATTDGGDLLDLWQATRGISFVDTLREVKGYLGIEDMPKFKERKHQRPEKPSCKTPNEKMLKWWKDCGVSGETVAKLKIGQKDNAIVFPYISPNGDLELVKYREMGEKKFWSNKDPIPCLFGWQAVEDNHRDIVICEGEKDCLTFWQQGIPALSVPKGAGSGNKQDWIEYEYDRLERFTEIFICMDSDKAGQEAVVEIIDRLGRHRCKVVNLTYGGVEYKDPNEAHLDGVTLGVFLKTAKTVDPEELKRLSEFHNDIMAELDPERQQHIGLKLPWAKTFDLIRLRPSEVSIYAGINSHGKSDLLSHIMVDGVTQGTKWCVASMEMPAKKLGAKVYRQAGGVDHPSSQYAEKIRQLIDNNVYIFTTYGTAKADRILDVFEYARKRYGVTHFVIDSMAKCGFAEDDYKSQKFFVDRLFEYALQNGIHIHLVLHMRKGDSEEKPPGKFDVKGTGAITDMVSNVFIVWRNKKKERMLNSGDDKEIEKARNQADTQFICVKQRETGVEPNFLLWFHPQSCQFLERKLIEPKRYIE